MSRLIATLRRLLDDSQTPPLNVQHVTEGSRVMLRAYPITLTIIGVLFIAQPPLRLSSDAFDVPKLIMPMDMWGIAFCWVAAGMFAALLSSKRLLYGVFLVLGAGLVGFWATLTGIATTQSPVVSFTVPVWVAFPMVCLIATARSLSRDWVMRSGSE